MVTAEWLKSRIARHEARRLAEARSEGYAEGYAEGFAEGLAEGRAKALAVLDKDTRKEVERKLRLIEHS